MPAASVLPVSSRRAAAATVAPHARGGMRLLILAVLVLLAAAVALSHEAMSYRTLTIRLERAVEEAEATLQHVTVEHANATASSDSASDPAAQQQVVQVQAKSNRTAAAGNGARQEAPSPAATPGEVVLNETHCLDTCCWRYEEVTWHYAGEKGRRPRIDDRLNPGEAKTLADVVMHISQGVHPIYPIPEWQPPFTELSAALLPCLQPGTVIFIEGNTHQRFFEELHPKIQVPYILVSGDGDDPSPGKYRHMIDDPKIIAWWGFNCDFPNIHMVPKFHCYPLGLTQWWDARDHMQEAFDKGLVKLHWEKPEDPDAELASVGKKLFLANFLVTSSPVIRQAAIDHFCNGPLANYSSCNTTNDRQVFDYFQRVRDHMFNVAPEGVGLDCYRQWETLYLGRYPIVLNSSINEVFSGLPVWIVDKWEDVTVERARFVFDMFNRKQWQWEKLYKGYWQKRIYEHRLTRQKNVRIVYSPRASGAHGIT